MTLYPAGLFSSFYLCLDGTTRFSHRYVHRGCHQRPAGLLLWHQLSLFSPSTLSHFWNLKSLSKKKESSSPTNLPKIEDNTERCQDFKLKLTTRAKTLVLLVYNESTRCFYLMSEMILFSSATLFKTWIRGGSSSASEGFTYSKFHYKTCISSVSNSAILSFPREPLLSHLHSTRDIKIGKRVGEQVGES